MHGHDHCVFLFHVPGTQLGFNNFVIPGWMRRPGHGLSRLNAAAILALCRLRVI